MAMKFSRVLWITLNKLYTLIYKAEKKPTKLALLRINNSKQLFKHSGGNFSN